MVKTVCGRPIFPLTANTVQSKENTLKTLWIILLKYTDDKQLTNSERSRKFNTKMLVVICKIWKIWSDIRKIFVPLDLCSLSLGGAKPTPADITRYLNILFRCLCTDYNKHFAWFLVLGLYKEDYLQILKCVSLINTAFVISGKIRIPLTCLTTRARWLSLLQQTVRSRSFIVGGFFLCCHFAILNFLLI